MIESWASTAFRYLSKQAIHQLLRTHHIIYVRLCTGLFHVFAHAAVQE